MKQLDLKEKLYWPIDKLKNWDRNPRALLVDDYDRLKKQIIKLGQYKPLIINSGKNFGEEGVILGGNMRFKAYTELDIKDVWVSLVDPASEAEMLEYALSDNDQAGFYEQQKLAELVLEVKNIDVELYKIDSGNTQNLKDVLAKFAPSTSSERLDQLTGHQVKCPECGHEFEA